MAQELFNNKDEVILYAFTSEKRLWHQDTSAGSVCLGYCIARKFGGDNIWRKWMDKDLGERKLGE